MVFSSLLFLFRFLPIALFVYFVAPGKYKNLVLFLMSLVFYAWGEPVYVCLMIFSTIVDYTHGKLVHRFQENGENRKAKMVVFSSVVINLLLLGFFKYADFVIMNINALCGLSIPLLKLGLPIGISFYTFQTMSYTIDVYRGDAKVQNNIISFGAYVALFPQLIAGPIVQYKTVDEQLNHRTVTMEGFAYGVRRFVCGLAKKVLLANNIGILWEQCNLANSVLMAWLGAIAFTFQIYFDFSGYSDMAIGLGHMLGFRFNENFNYPYLSKSITEFWRRWHISLGTWFREYVYIPLGGNRAGKARQIRNIFVVWLLTGIWHGASWNFMVWGVYFGILLILEKMFLKSWLDKLPNVVSHIYTMFFVVVSWVIFAFDSLQEGLAHLGKMFGIGVGTVWDEKGLYLLVSYAVLLLILVIASTPYPKKCAAYICHKLGDESVAATILTSVYLIVLLGLSVAFIVDASYNPFLYFRF